MPLGLPDAKVERGIVLLLTHYMCACRPRVAVPHAPPKCTIACVRHTYPRQRKSGNALRGDLGIDDVNSDTLDRGLAIRLSAATLGFGVGPIARILDIQQLSVIVYVGYYNSHMECTVSDSRSLDTTGGVQR